MTIAPGVEPNSTGTTECPKTLIMPMTIRWAGRPSDVDTVSRWVPPAASRQKTHAALQTCAKLRRALAMRQTWIVS